MDDRVYGRAAFLGILGAGAAGLVWGRDLADLAGRLLPRQVAALVPSRGWRIYTIRGVPRIDPARYRLRVDGLVERPLSLSLEDLRALPRAEQVSDFHCVSGWSVKNVHWAGVRFDDLLGEAGLKPEARYLQFVSAEVPYVDTLTVEQALLPDVLLALEMDGKPLTRPHGFPARVVMPRMYGYKSVKWVSRIHARRDFVPGYWETHGYDSDAWIGKSNFFRQGLE
ncbi:MAG TPA: molybdopterin-dependent oxidoreductase [Gaiellaceae bacterium]|nr:molybdopterin-dependent oxidoreductase [Gaiellaceae bacterium]